MWVTKLLISPVKKRIFCPKTTKFGPKLAFLVNLGQCPVGGSVSGCGARAVSRKTPIYFIIDGTCSFVVVFVAVFLFLVVVVFADCEASLTDSFFPLLDIFVFVSTLSHPPC